MPTGFREYIDSVNNFPTVKYEDTPSMERPISEEELLKLIKSLLNNKAPGEDGLPAEFYKVFWIDIKKYLLDSYNFSYNNNTLSITQKRGVISLIPKKDDPLLLKKLAPLIST